MKQCITSLTIRLTLLFSIIGALFACNFDTGKSAEGGTSGTGIVRAAGLAKGTITGFGSVVAGGIRFDTDGATVDFNGESGTVDQLEVGMIVVVKGEVDTATFTGLAETVEFSFNVLGAIDVVDTDTRSIIAVGQRVIFDERTSFVNTDADSLAEGDIIAVSGLVDSNGTVLASYIEKLVTTPLVSTLQGLVGDLDLDASTFKIGDQTFDFSSAQLINMPNGLTEEGILIRVTLSGETGGAGQNEEKIFLVSSVEKVGSPLTGPPIELVSIEGIVTQALSGDQFFLGGSSVLVDDATEYVNGTRNDIAVDTVLRVEGHVNTDELLVATRITFTPKSLGIIEAIVDEINSAQNTIKLLGKTVLVDNFTVMLDKSDANIREFSLANISVGDRVVVNIEDTSAGVIASRVERVNTTTDPSVAIEGPVDAPISDPVFSIAGTTVDTTALEDNLGFSEGDIHPITRAGFFSAIQPGMVARATGTFTSGVFSPDKVTIVHCCHFGFYPAPGVFVGSTDVMFTWDGSLNTDANSTNVNATLSSPSTFFAWSWQAREVRIFGPGEYVFDTGLDWMESTQFGTTNLGGKLIRLTVGPGQLGAHMLMDWGPDVIGSPCGKDGCNIDIAVLWDVNGVYTGSTGISDDLGAKGQIFNLASVDGDGDGVPGFAMVEYWFQGVNVVFNLNITSPPQ
ncbi:MAG: DUF5666 domain-containing protein [Gammaproteobacteria bacterium]